jgi:hypothetical protein
MFFNRLHSTFKYNKNNQMQYIKLFSLVMIFLISLFGASSTFAQCANPSEPSCTVYESCFSKYCSCKGDPNEYFETYGAKYCKRFLEEIKFSPIGEKWRNSTLICLQEAIVPKLDISDKPVCDCSSMKKYAFESHVACYTKPGASICDLPFEDVKKISKVIDMADIFSSEGWQQMKQVTKICEKTSPDDGRRSIWRALAAILSVR